MTDTLGELLSAYLYAPNDFMRGVLGDYLEENGRIAQKRVLHGRCYKCGGRMRKLRANEWYGRPPLTEDYWRCKRCKEDDEMYINAPSSWFFRVLRELGFVVCEANAHWLNRSWNPQRLNERVPPLIINPEHQAACGKCNGLGIVRRK